jgi:hypothetical protein
MNLTQKVCFPENPNPKYLSSYLAVGRALFRDYGLKMPAWYGKLFGK